MAGRIPEQLALSAYLGPRHWPTWLAVGLMWLISRLPYRLTMKIGRLVGRSLYYLSTHRRYIATRNIQLAFPELSAAEQTQLVKKSFASLGQSMVEMPLAWWGDENKLQKLVTIEGLEHAKAAMANGHGIILVGGHMNALEIGGRLLAPHLPIMVTYRMQTNPLMDVLMFRNRSRTFHDVIERMDMRGMVRGIQKGFAMWYAPDQDFGAKRSVFVPFFGVATATLTAPAKLARLAKAPAVPLFFYRHDDDSGYTLRILPPLENYPSDDEVRDAALLNKTIEDAVRLAPEQYMWVHRRFRSRPKGEPKRY